jgi:hypothetical protein
MEQKSRPLEVRIQVVNPKDWEKDRKLSVRIKGLFRNSAWKVKNYTSQLYGNVIDIKITTENVGRLGAMVLTPFEVIADVPLKDLEDKYRIRAIIDGEECAAQNF